MGRIVTQLNPDLDACLGVWLLRRFGGFDEADILFVSTGNRVPYDDDVVYVDTSGGKYDHHDTNELVCAASLVFDDLKLQSDEALRQLVDFTILVDHGLLMDKDLGRFNVVHMIYGLNRLHADRPDVVIDISGHIFDSLYAHLRDELAAATDFERAIHFESKWGAGVGVETSNRQVRYLAHYRGYRVFVFVDPKTGFRGFQSPGGSGIDFSETYEVLKLREPDADWFLHASKELLLCGSLKAPEKRLSRLALPELVSVISVQPHLYGQDS
jgi:hypothetical protein